ncbi:MAG TPA: hypothetical protein VF338_07850 [Leptolinea sp.]
MKKHVFFLVILFLLVVKAFPQVAINTDGSQPNSAAILDVSSTTKGFLAPRMTTLQRTALSATAIDGLMVYDTDLHNYFFFKGGSINAWEQQLGSSTGWSLNGNGGTDSTINLIGTTNSQAVIFKTNNSERLRINKVGNIGIGINNPHEQLELTGNLRIPATTATAGIIYMGSDRFIHIYGTGSMFIGISAGNLTNTGQNNTATGNQSLNSITSGRNNTAYGYNSLFSTTTPYGNNAFGNLALYSNNQGWYNCAFGDRALYSNQNGGYNIAMGYQALYTNQDGINNTAIGHLALNKNVGGGNNNAVGYNALLNNSSGSGNNAHGSLALANNTTGSFNSAFGNQAMAQSTSGAYNAAFGVETLMHNSTGVENVCMGYRALLTNTTGSENTVLGSYAGNLNLDGSRNTIIGDSAGYYNSSGNKNVFLGYKAGMNETGSQKLYIENSPSSAVNALLYGEFDNDILATSGKFGIGTITPNSSLQVSGSFATAVVSKSASYSPGNADQVILCTADMTATLPSAIGIEGRQYTIKRTYASGSGATIATSAAQTIDGATTYSLSGQWKYITVVSDGSNWLIIGNN